MFCEDFKEWFESNKNNVFRYVVFKRMFTPYETQSAFTDESVYESNMYSFCKIEEVADLKNGEWLLGLRSIDSDTFEPFEDLQYYRLSEIRLAKFSRDNRLEQDENESNWEQIDEQY